MAPTMCQELYRPTALQASHLMLTTIHGCRCCSVTVPTLQWRKLRQNEVEWLAQGHKPGKSLMPRNQPDSLPSSPNYVPGNELSDEITKLKKGNQLCPSAADTVTGGDKVYIGVSLTGTSHIWPWRRCSMYSPWSSSQALSRAQPPKGDVKRLLPCVHETIWTTSFFTVIPWGLSEEAEFNCQFGGTVSCNGWGEAKKEKNKKGLRNYFLRELGSTFILQRNTKRILEKRLLIGIPRETNGGIMCPERRGLKL